MSVRLAIVTVTHDSAAEIGAFIASVRAHPVAGPLEIVVVDSNSSDGTPDRLERDFPDVRVIRAANRGYAAGLNVGIRATTADYVLLCNPDLEILDGSLEDLVLRMGELRDVGVAGVRQLDGKGELIPTIRRRPTGLRMLADALAAERLPLGGGLGERVLDRHLYERDTPCAWVSGSFMLCRRDALEAVGDLDESFFLYSEETDLALRIATAGYRVVHLPEVTVVHREKASTGKDPRLEAQAAWSRLRLARKHLSRIDRGLFRVALALRYAVRAHRPAARRGLAVTLGLAGSPFGPAPRSAEMPPTGTGVVGEAR